MEEINKICFFLNWVREVDMFRNIYKNFEKKNLFFLINDLNKKNKNQKEENKKITILLKEKNLHYDFLSNVLNKKKFKILISTADLPITKINFFSILKFVYGKTIGLTFQLTKTNILLKKLFNREFVAHGKNASIYEDYFVEKDIAKTAIKFPNGLDRNIKHFPNSKWEKIFDVFLTSSIIEEQLVKKKFKSKITLQIGYPRFSQNINNFNKEVLKKEFSIKNEKKTIFCCPNERIIFEQKENSIFKYIQVLKLLDKKFNLILRPHPKLQYTKPKYFEIFKKSGLKLDVNMSRSIQDIFLISDIVLVDYGSSVLEALYLKKKILVYEWPYEKNFNVIFDKANCLDFIFREKMSTCKIKENIDKDNIFNLVNKIIDDEKIQLNINNLNTELFGNNEINDNFIDFIKNLYE